MSEDAKVGVVIVNYNGFEYVVDCVKSLMLSTWNNLDIIVVDNGSSDGSVNKLGDMFGDSIIVVDNGVNLGFAGGNNVGIRLALERQCDLAQKLTRTNISNRDGRKNGRNRYDGHTFPKEVGVQVEIT